jgi:hypothetical protein
MGRGFPVIEIARDKNRVSAWRLAEKVDWLEMILGGVAGNPADRNETCASDKTVLGSPVSIGRSEVRRAQLKCNPGLAFR